MTKREYRYHKRERLKRRYGIKYVYIKGFVMTIKKYKAFKT